MLDFIFRRGNPTNGWMRTPNLTLTVSLDAPSLNGVILGSRFDRLSSLGRNDTSQFGTLCYLDLGIGVDQVDDGRFLGYMVVLFDENNDFQPYRGELLWKEKRLDASQLTRDELPNVFGDWYWMDTDETESIAFYEYPDHEMQIELTLSGLVKRFILTKNPLMADPNQRQSYNVDKPWPPHCGK